MYRISILLILFLSATTLYSQDDIAITTKTEGETRLRRAQMNEYDLDLLIGTKIRDQDWIRTGEGSYGIIVFIDDKSQLKIQSNSEVEILGEASRQTAAISKRVMMEGGKLKAEISQQRRGQFVIVTPTSVASVKGTIFWMVVSETLGDRVFVLDGLMMLFNSISGDSVLVGRNQTGSSNTQGDVQIINTAVIGGEVDEYTANAQMVLRNISLIDGELEQNITGPGPLTIILNEFTAFEDREPQAGERVTVAGQVQASGDFEANVIEVEDSLNNLEIEFENEDGERKRLKIEYR